jgi:diamine N-acetyltransferase
MIRLERISGKNVWEILKLRVSDAQKSFVAPNDVSIIEAYIAVSHHGHAFPFGIYDDETPVGFCMIGFGTDDDWEDAPAIAKGSYNLWRFMIDERYQRKGYGRAAMHLILDFIAGEPCGPAEYCWLSYEPENTAAKALYASFGFTETGEWDGGEVIAALKLNWPKTMPLIC